MFTTNYSCYILKKRQASVLGVLIALAITAAVTYGVGLYAGKQAPKGLNHIMPYILLSTISLIVLCFIYYFAKRFKIIVIGENEKLTIEIKDPSLTEPFIINSPIKISMQWIEQLMPKGGKMKILYFTICSAKGEPLVTFEGALGSAYDAPRTFEFINVFEPEEGKHLIVSSKKYSTGKIRVLAEEVRIYMDYIEKKKVNPGGHSPLL